VGGVRGGEGAREWAPGATGAVLKGGGRTAQQTPRNPPRARIVAHVVAARAGEVLGAEDAHEHEALARARNLVRRKVFERAVLQPEAQQALTLPRALRVRPLAAAERGPDLLLAALLGDERPQVDGGAALGGRGGRRRDVSGAREEAWRLPQATVRCESNAVKHHQPRAAP
jgi:hypothetical protein